MILWLSELGLGLKNKIKKRRTKNKSRDPSREGVYIFFIRVRDQQTAERGRPPKTPNFE